MTMAAACITMLSIGTIVLVIIGVPVLGFAIYARVNTTTAHWPDPDVVAMREGAEQQIPPPPASSFEDATITTYYDGDRWRCSQYKTTATPEDIRAYYDGHFRAFNWTPVDLTTKMTAQT